MKALLDTHTFLWWITDDPKISGTVSHIIKNQDNEIFFSTASAWEISIKSRLNRIKLTQMPDIFIPDQLQKNYFQILPIQLNHTLKEFSLPAIHNDPFDRILIAQSITEDIPLLTADAKMKKYEVKIIW